jgi:uncharacterized protein (DUF58 family)
MRKNRLLYLALLIASISYLYAFGGKVPYMFFSFVLVLLIVSFFYTLIIYYSFKYTQDIDKKFVTKGDKIKFLFNVGNEDFLLYPYLKVTFCGSDTIFANQLQIKYFSLLPRKRKTFAFELECKYRGNYEMGIKSIEIEDFLGIFKFSYNISETKYVTVYPRIVYLDKFYLRTNFLSETHSVLDSKFEDMATISDIREYRFGDSFKKIHWKLTAKSNELMVKNFQSTSETSAVILLDLKRNKFGRELNIIIEDKIIEAVVAVIYYCLSNWIPINLIYYNDKLVSLTGQTPLDFDEIFKTLSKINFHENVGVHDILEIYLSGNAQRTNFIIFTCDLSYDLFNLTYKTKFSGNDISIVYISPDYLTGSPNIEADNIIAYLPEIAVNSYKIDINDDIKSVLER